MARMLQYMGWDIPVLGSVYVLTPAAAHIINAGKVPGAYVTDWLLHLVENEWRQTAHGRAAAIKRAAQLAAVLKGIGYTGGACRI